MPRMKSCCHWLAVTVCFASTVLAQTPPPQIPPATTSQAAATTPTGTASITGQIKQGDKGIAGAVVLLTNVPTTPATNSNANPNTNPTTGAGRQRPQPFAPSTAGGSAVTDTEGRYEIKNVVAGAFRVMVSAPGYVLSGSEVTVQLADGQAVQNLNLNLAKGGVITGKVIHGTRPVIGEPVTLTPVDATGQPAQMRLPAGLNMRTDDRGIFRLFGLPAGRYLVSVGRGNGDSAWQRTFYPDALEQSAATPVAVEPGQELTGIDIRMATRATYAIVGRVVDAETNQPVPGVLIGYSQLADPRANRFGPNNQNNQGGQNNPAAQNNRANQPVVVDQGTDASSNAAGEFRIAGLTPGNFQVYVARDRATDSSEFYSQPVPVEIKSGDVSGVEIKLLRGASIMGVVAFDNPNDPNVQANLPNLLVRASSRNPNVRGGGGAGGLANDVATQPGSDGFFRLAGLAPGLVTLTLVERGTSGLTILRIERDGADLQSGLRVEAGEQVVGVRLLAAYGNSVIRGIVQVEGGLPLPAQVRLTVSARRVDASASVRDRAGRNTPVDASGRFQIDQLVAGTYELTLQAPGLGRNTLAPINVTVGSNTTQNAVIPLNQATLQTLSTRGNPRGIRQ